MTKDYYKAMEKHYSYLSKNYDWLAKDAEIEGETVLQAGYLRLKERATVKKNTFKSLARGAN